MAANFTFGSGKQQARLYADQRGAEFISDAELGTLYNAKARELYDKLVDARGLDYYEAEAVISIEPGTSRYDLPADFYQLNSVTLEWAQTEHELVRKIQTSRDRARFTSNQVAWSKYDKKGYRLRNNQIEFLPVPSGSVDCRIQYVPTFTDLVDDADTFDGVNGFEKMIALGVAIEMMAIDKRSSAQLNALYAEQLERIEQMKSERDAEANHEVIDVERVNTNPWYGPTFDDSFDPSFW